MGKVDYSRWAEVRKGLGASLAVGLGMVPLGMAFGLIVLQAGLPWWLAPALSIFIYAGSLELFLVSMIATTAPLATVALTSFLVNFRHVFYAFTYPISALRTRRGKAYGIYALTDETYAVTAVRPDGWTGWSLISLQLALQTYWVGGGLIGVLIGSMLPPSLVGLEFAMCALFITLTLDATRTRKQVPSLLLAGLSYSVAAVVTPDAPLFTGLLLFVGLLLVRFAVGERAAETRNEA